MRSDMFFNWKVNLLVADLAGKITEEKSTVNKK